MINMSFIYGTLSTVHMGSLSTCFLDAACQS